MTKNTEHASPAVNLASIVHESEAAAAEAAEAQAKAMAAQAKADRVRERAERERHVANETYLQWLEAEYPVARDRATTAQGEVRQALEDAVRNGGDIFTAYHSWVAASLAVWELEAALSQQRHYLGRPTREATPPAFDFGRDIGAIIDQHSMELQDEALARIRERRAAFLSGQEG